MSKVAVMAFSGGMDSTGLLMRLLADDFEVHTLSYDYGQKHKIELERAKANIQYLSENNIQVSHKIVDLQSAMSVFYSALTTDDYEIPEGHYEEEQMKQTVVPNTQCNLCFNSLWICTFDSFGKRTRSQNSTRSSFRRSHHLS